MNRFGAIIEQLSYIAEPEDQVRLLRHYLSTVSDDDRAAVAAMLSSPRFRHVKPALLRALIRERVSDALYALSRKFVGDTSETIALLWQSSHGTNREPTPSGVLEMLKSAGPSALPKLVVSLLDTCDVSGRHLLIKYLTGAFRSPVSETLLTDVFGACRIPATFALVPTGRPGKQADLFLVDVELNPGTIEAVLLYVEKGRSRTSPLLCTIGVWNGEVLVPVGRVEAGQHQSPIEVFTTKSAVRRFGPATEVQHSSVAAMVLHVSFDGVTTSKRRKTGLTLIAPRIVSIAEGASVDAASHVEELTNLLPPR
ncbi:MAG: hypothetical protein ABL973_08000 [Micropepsaceae bacterium]